MEGGKWTWLEVLCKRKFFPCSQQRLFQLSTNHLESVLAIGFSWAIWKGSLSHRAWLAIVVLQAVLLGAGLVALRAGLQEEDRVESVVPKAALERHEALAQQFLWIAGLTLATSSIVIIARRPGVVQALTVMTVLGSFLTAAAALRVGHAGGQLVYVHNPGAAYVSDSKSNPQAGNASGKSPAAESNVANKNDD